MKTTQDEFSKFIAQIILDIPNYSFDLFYDVARIMNDFRLGRSQAENPNKATFHLMIRSTGCDLVKPDDENYKLFLDRSTTVYSLVFCWNYSYMRDEEFCNIDKIV